MPVSISPLIPDSFPLVTYSMLLPQEHPLWQLVTAQFRPGKHILATISHY